MMKWIFFEQVNEFEWLKKTACNQWNTKTHEQKQAKEVAGERSKFPE